MKFILPVIFLALAACTGASGDGSAPARQAPREVASTREEQPPVVREPPPAEAGATSFPPSSARDSADLMAGCPHMNSEKRPRGRNCYGIFPEQCGADKAAQFIARSATPDLREQIAGLSPGGDVRFIGPGDAVIADLRLDRLNVHLTDAGRITSVDCY